ncbi:MAG: ABC transporter permease [Candidatus Hydrogenedentes bacterium]|nr:ABC transporter permease [Candidatus Hydrogenedentota bacterium]
MGFFLVMKAEVVRSLIIMRRYWFATATGIVIAYAMFMTLIFGFMKGVVDPGWAERATGTTLGLVIGMFAFGIAGIFTQGLQTMARSGELEQLCMSPHGLIANFMARSCVGAAVSILSWTVLLALISATLKTKLHIAPVPIVMLLILTYINLIGFGFMVGGLVLVFKQTGQVAMILRMALMGIAVTVSEKIYEWPAPLRILAHMAPISDATICLKRVLLDGAGMGIVTHASFFCLIISCVVWTTLGLACFKFMENWSRDKGTLGVY